MAVLIVACVPARQYQDMEKSKRSYQYQNDTLRAYVKNIVSLTAAERDEFAKLKRDNKSLNEDILKEKERYARLDETNQDILNRYDRLLNQMKELNGNNNNTGGGGATNSVIVLREAELQRTEALLKERELEVQRIKTEYETKLRDLQSNQSNLQGQLSAREQRVAELETTIKMQKSMVDNAVSKVKNDMQTYFTGGDMSIEEKNGKVYIALSQNLLFPSGSKVLDKKGKDALKRLAFVLNETRDMDIFVEGHSDSDGNVNENWDLSVLRATTVVKELSANGVEQRRIIASGRGSHIPVVPNDTPTNKAKNRRTEIILSPKVMDDIYKTLNK